MHLLLIIAWVLAILCMVYLAKELLRNWLDARGERRLANRSKRRQRFIERRRRLMQRRSGVVSQIPDDTAADSRQTQKLVGWMALILWQGYWLVEIADQFRKSAHPLQLPYFFLFIVMVVIPYTVYWISRRMTRRTIEP